MKKDDSNKNKKNKEKENSQPNEEELLRGLKNKNIKINDELIKKYKKIAENKVLPDAENKSETQSSEEYEFKCNNEEILCLAEKLATINLIRDEITKLQLDPLKKNFYLNDIDPLLTTLQTLAISAERFSTAALNTYNIHLTKTSKIENLLCLVLEISRDAEEVLAILEKEIDIMLNIYKKDFRNC